MIQAYINFLHQSSCELGSSFQCVMTLLNHFYEAYSSYTSNNVVFTNDNKFTMQYTHHTLNHIALNFRQWHRI